MKMEELKKLIFAHGKNEFELGLIFLKSPMDDSTAKTKKSQEYLNLIFKAIDDNYKSK